MPLPLVKHGELSVQQMSDIQKSILVNARRESFWGKFCSHTPFASGHDAIEWRKLALSKLTASDIVNLTEGHTPDPKKLVYVNFKTSVVDYGNWIAYTDKSKRYNYDDVVRDAKTSLGDDADQQAELRKGAQFIAGTCTITEGANFLATLLKAKVILKKNGAKPVARGKYACIMSSEQAAEVLVAYKDSIQYTSQKESIIEGYLGELGGFILYETTSPLIYKTSSIAYVLFMGKSIFGMPVGTISIGNDGVEVFDKGLGSIPELDNGVVKPDALNQRGSVGYKVMGFGTRIIADECILRGEHTVAEITESVDPADVTRQHYDASSDSPDTDVVMSVTVTQAADGAAIASPTIVVKSGATQGSGTSISAETDGTYVLDGNVYNISVAKTGFVTQTRIVYVSSEEQLRSVKAIAFALVGAQSKDNPEWFGGLFLKTANLSL